MNRGKSKRILDPDAVPDSVETPPADTTVEDQTDPTFDSGPRNDQRLQKIIAAAGLTSRRKAEELILTGRVQVNGTMVSELGTKADPGRDHIRVDGKLLKPVTRLYYFILNKPKGYITSASDPEGRPTVMEFFERTPVRVYPVGRLDYQSEGLLVMTNDGELANLLTKASSKVEKTYLVKIAGVPTEAALNQLRAGIMIEKGKIGSHEGRVLTQPARIRMARDADNPWYEVILTEGRNREIRKMFEEIGHFVEKIRRVGYGPLVLDIEPGEIRELDAVEITALQRAARGIISRVRPPAIKLPSAKRKHTSAPRPSAPSVPKATAASQAVNEREYQLQQKVTEIFLPSSSTDEEREERPRLNVPRKRTGERTSGTERNSGTGRTSGTGRAAGTSRATGTGRQAYPERTSGTGRPSPTGRPSGTGRAASTGRSPGSGRSVQTTRTREDAPAIDPRTGSPYRVLFGDRPNASNAAGPGKPATRKPATFDLSKRPKTGTRPPSGARSGAPSDSAPRSKPAFGRKPSAGKRDRSSRRP